LRVERVEAARRQARTAKLLALTADGDVETAAREVRAGPYT